MSRELIYNLCFVLLLSLVLGSTANAALPGLIGWYKLDEGSGTIANDSSGLGNHGTLGPEGNPQWVVGIRGGALDLDGADDYVNLDVLADDITDNNFSCSAWIKTTQAGTDDCIIASNSGGGHDFVLGVHADGLLVEADSANVYPPKINNNQWHHVAYVRDGTTAYAYTDGVLVGTETPSGNPSTQTRWSIGQEWDSSPSDEYDGLVDDVQFYNRPLTAEEVVMVMIGVPPGAATNPSPENEATDVNRDGDLSWTPGEFAPAVNGHRVYLSESFNDVNDELGAITQSASSYDPGRLNFGTTYYWRVDEVNAPPDSTVYPGAIWSFTTEPFAYPVSGANITATASSSGQPDLGPENTINGSGLDDNDLHSTTAGDMWLSGFSGPEGAWIQYEFDKVYKIHEVWVWNSNTDVEASIGFGARDVAIEYSVDGNDYTPLGTAHEFSQALADPSYAHNTTVDFGGAPAKHVRFTVSTNWGGWLPQFGLAEVRFFQIPVSASAPSPDSGATDVEVDVALGWRAGREVATHNVSFSTDEQAVIDGTAPVAAIANASYSPADLALNTSYYWKVDEVNDAETPSTWESGVWSFTTSDHIVVEDFESYNDVDPPDPTSNRIFDVWIDGYGVASNGALVGHDPPNPSYAETAIMHGGSQSMPIFYSNTLGAASSEATITFAAPQNWTAHGVTTLGLWFYGTAGNTGQLYLKINGTKLTSNASLGLDGWQLWTIDLATSGASLQSVGSLTVGIDGFGASGTLYVDDAELYAVAPPPITEWRITASTNDGEEHPKDGGTMEGRGSSDLEFGHEGAMSDAAAQTIGCRWVAIPIPQGVTITEAWVQFSADDINNPYHIPPVSVIIEGQLDPSPAAFSGTANDISSRPKTAAKVVWDIPQWTTVHAQGPDERTPDISSIIQEIVNQPGWAGSAIVLTFRDNPANPSQGTREAESFDGSPSEAPLLHISYQ